MKLELELVRDIDSVEIEDVVFFSHCDAYMILKDDGDGYCATQIMNSNNERMGIICFYEKEIDTLMRSITKEGIKTPVKIVHMRDLKISFLE